MKSKLLKNSILVLFLAFLISACNLIDDNGEEARKVDKFLVSYEVVKSYLPQFMHTSSVSKRAYTVVDGKKQDGVGIEYGAPRDSPDDILPRNPSTVDDQLACASQE